jgi:hypothetical protein
LERARALIPADDWPLHSTLTLLDALLPDAPGGRDAQSATLAALDAQAHARADRLFEVEVHDALDRLGSRAGCEPEARLTLAQRTGLRGVLAAIPEAAGPTAAATATP